jgi:hypothetical protein
MRCTRCERDLDGIPLVPTPSAGIAKKRSDEVAPPTPQIALRRGLLADADWQLEADLRGIHRLIHSLRARSAEDSLATTIPKPHLREPYAAVRSQPHETIPEPSAKQATGATTASLVQVVGWLILSIGLAIFACGSVLLGWTLIAGREDLWRLGMPLAVIGQSGLVLGLVLQLNGLWVAHRKSAAALSDLDDEFKQVRPVSSRHTPCPVR